MGDTVDEKIGTLAEEANELCLGFRHVFYKVINEVRPGLVLIVVAEVSAVQLHTKHWSGTKRHGGRGDTKRCTALQNSMTTLIRSSRLYQMRQSLLGRTQHVFASPSNHMHTRTKIHQHLACSTRSVYPVLPFRF